MYKSDSPPNSALCLLRTKKVKTKSLHFVSILSVMLIQMQNSEFERFFEEESEGEVHPPTPLPFTQPPVELPPPPPLDTVLPPYRPPPEVAAALPPPPAAAAALPPPVHQQKQQQSCCQQQQQQQQQRCPHRQQQSCPHLQQQKQEHRYLHQPHQYWHQCPHHHFACCHPGRCHHHPHGSHGQNQVAAAIEEAGGEEKDKAEEPYIRTLRTHIRIISIIKFFNLPSSLTMNL